MAPGDTATFTDLISFLPARVWYLSHSGQDMWCRRPYGFFFSTGEAAMAFAASMAPDADLTPVGVDSKELISDEGLQAMRMQAVTRIFLDPEIDAATGDVFGRILRLEPVN